VSSETTPDADPDFMHIGEVAARTDLSLRSLRHWEEVGLVRPSARTEGGFRLYTEDDVDKILVIRRMKPLGFTLDEMRAVMTDIDAVRHPSAAEVDRSAARSRLGRVRQEAGERREKLVRQVAMADEFLEIINRELAPGPSQAGR
jgi:DNA-binding transcriptional MerR regulator